MVNYSVTQQISRHRRNDIIRSRKAENREICDYDILYTQKMC